MSDDVTVEHDSCRWAYLYRMRLIRNAPPTVDPETGAVIDPTTGSLEFRWYARHGGWVLVEAEVSGLEILGEGHGDVQIDCRFIDPRSGGPGDGRAPDWLLELAAKRQVVLPTPPDEEGARG